MPYDKRARVIELESHGWIELHSFRSRIRAMWYRSLLNEPDTARNACDSVLNLMETPPFDVDSRFPNSLMYVDIDHPYVVLRLHTIIEVLSWMDRQEDVTPDCSEFAERVDRLKDAVFQLLCPRGGVGDGEDQSEFGNYTRDTFERTFDLAWVGKPYVESGLFDINVII